MEKSTVVRHSIKGKGDYFRTTIPKEICEGLGLKEGDVLGWEIAELDGRKVIIIRRLE